MCTVTFIPVKDKLFITANRDEKQARAVAIPPSAHQMNSGRLVYPEDGEAGGSWFAVHENGNAVIFLNGAWKKHDPRPPYRKSRGLVLLDLADQDTAQHGFLSISLEGIEPFTAVIRQGQGLFVCRWDGVHKNVQELPADVPHIWSSVTLYDEKTILKRAGWFTDWLAKNPFPSQEDILLFHQFTGDGDLHNDLLMNRDNQVFTVSITSAAFSEKDIQIRYIDLIGQQSYLHRIDLPKAILSN
jgi:hypothetical protein